MRTTVIPAQITTVEDKIAGNLNLTQIFILMIPIFWTTIVYMLFAPTMRIALYKFPLILVVLFLCLILSLRIKGKVIAEWLIVLLKFQNRPKYYLFDKNDTFLRTLDLPHFEKKPVRLFKPKLKTVEVKQPSVKFGIADFVKLENIIGNPKYTVSFKSERRGGINVAFEQLKK
ncbi:hypothetical protein HY310_02310 [Candidatus Microgenomates bacterium]|nr:hypothetical protein [Candidatus Microgenomates bacterium]